MATYPIHLIDRLIPNFSAQKPSKAASNQSLSIANRSMKIMVKEAAATLEEGMPEVSALWQKAADLYSEAATMATNGQDAYCKLWEAKAARDAANAAFWAAKDAGQ